MTAIETKKLCKDYGTIHAVRSLDLQIGQGEVFALLGINGAGKSTTIGMLTGVIPPTSGDAVLLGHSVKQEPEQVKRLIGVSPQETAVAEKLTVLENLLLIASIGGASKAEAKERAAEMLSSFGLTEYASRRAAVLSGGCKRRLSLAMALILKPQILFLDEPTLGLDVIARHELWDSIRALKNKTTVILTTHYLEEAVALCDRIAILEKGGLCAVGTADELIKQSGEADFESAFVRLAGGNVK